MAESSLSHSIQTSKIRAHFVGEVWKLSLAQKSCGKQRVTELESGFA